LVVIGILIALGINNWNENRKSSELEESYYCLLLNDIEEDKEQIKTLIAVNKKRIENSNIAITTIQSENIDLTELGSKINLSRRDMTQSFIPNSSTYEDIKSSGNINTLKDSQIRKSLNQYIKKTEDLNSVILGNMNLVFNRLAQTADWFNSGVLHAEYKKLFPREIQKNLSVDFPNKIPEETKARLYEDLVMEGILLRRRSELLNLIDNQINIMNSKLADKCKVKSDYIK
tara:strand:+ start:58 stop:750 length:693 start_codon:yes stop_codon:yes gene_type:complete